MLLNIFRIGKCRFVRGYWVCDNRGVLGYSCFDSLDDMKADSDIIITGTVVRTETELRHDVVFTRCYVRIDKQEKGTLSAGTVIPVLQTGGTYGNITTPEIADAPLLKVGDSYELYLTATDGLETYKNYDGAPKWTTPKSADIVPINLKY